MMPRSGGETRTTWAAIEGVRPCLSTARLDAQSLRARRTRRGISSTLPPAAVNAFASLLVAPSRPATVISRRAVAAAREVARGISRSYLQRQGDRALLVGAQDVGWRTCGKPSCRTRRDELRGGCHRDSFEVWRQPAPAAVGEQQVRARTAQSRGGARLGVEVEVAQVAEGPAARRHHAQAD